MRSTFQTTLQATQGQLVFGRDVIHYIRFQENWYRIKNNKQKHIESSNKRENLNRIKHNKVLVLIFYYGDQVYDGTYRRPRRVRILYFKFKKLERLRYKEVACRNALIYA
jgi:hypothetical protein